MLALVFYALSALSMFLGATLAVVAVAQVASRLQWPDDYDDGFVWGHMIVSAGPGLWLVLGGLLLLALGHILQRLDQIAANTAYHPGDEP